jgi:Transglycosylase SLT domain
MPDEDFVDKHFNRVGIDPRWGRKIIRVESGGDPNLCTRSGTYCGLGQLDRKEFKAHGGTGDIFDPEQNVMALANKVAKEKLTFERQHGRPATLNDIYMIHQQGAAGYNTHLANPDAPAWQNFQKASGKSEKYSKDAIWGNMTPSMKAKYGSVENVTSAAFTSDWSQRMEGITPSAAMTRARARREAIPIEKDQPIPETDKKKLAEMAIEEVPPLHPIEITAPSAPKFSLPAPARVTR